MVSVIVPVYKSEKTLEKCVRSLCAQTEKDMEILLIVDGPPDGSGILAQKLAGLDERIRVIHQENQGVSRARNRGISEARGEYIRFVDSDDYVDADSNEKLLKALVSTGADLVIAGYHHLYFGRDILKNPKPGLYQTRELDNKDGGELLELYRAGFLNMPWNKLYKRELIGEGFPTDLNLGEDLLFNQKYIKRTDSICVIAAPVCNYIQDDRGTTLSTKRRTDKIPIALRLYDATRSFFEELGISGQEIIVSKLVQEFLDDLESLAFDRGLSRKEKLQVIHLYEDALAGLGEAAKSPVLELLDYRIIFPFYQKKRTGIVYFLVHARGLLARVLKKRG